MFTVQDVPPISTNLLVRFMTMHIIPRVNRMKGDHVRESLHGRKVRAP